jgi:hypothetical protein
MAVQFNKIYPAVHGLIWHRDRYYSFFIPNNWFKLDWSDDREGVIYAPDPRDPYTVFAVSLKDLGITVTADDLDILAEGFFESIEALAEADIEYSNQRATDRLLELEAKYTFCEQGEIRKRWVRVFFRGRHQIVMTAQGAAPEKYDYWLPYFFEAMMTAQIHNKKAKL